MLVVLGTVDQSACEDEHGSFLMLRSFTLECLVGGQSKFFPLVEKLDQSRWQLHGRRAGQVPPSFCI